MCRNIINLYSKNFLRKLKKRNNIFIIDFKRKYSSNLIRSRHINNFKKNMNYFSKFNDLFLS